MVNECQIRGPRPDPVKPGPVLPSSNPALVQPSPRPGPAKLVQPKSRSSLVHVQTSAGPGPAKAKPGPVKPGPVLPSSNPALVQHSPRPGPAKAKPSPAMPGPVLPSSNPALVHSATVLGVFFSRRCRRTAKFARACVIRYVPVRRALYVCTHARLYCITIIIEKLISRKKSDKSRACSYMEICIP